MDLQLARHDPALASQSQENRERIGVLLTHLINPGHFYVRITSVPPALTSDFNPPAISFEELSFKLKSYYRNLASSIKLDRVPGCICVVQLESGEFRRCKILNVHQVYLVDVGVTLSRVTSSQLRPLEDEWKLDHLPAMAFRCSLWGLIPPNHIMIWPKTSSERMTEMIANAGAQFMRVYHIVIEEGWILNVRLYYESIEPDNKDAAHTGCVNDQLVEQRLAHTVRPSGCPVSVGMPTEWPPCLSLPPYLEAKPTWIDEKGGLYIQHVDRLHHQLESIDSLLNWYYGESLPDREELTHWEMGQPCVAKCSGADGKWYRGRVLTADDGNKSATILFVDYGNQEKVLFKDMRRKLICFDYAIQAYNVRMAKYPGESPPTTAELRMLDRVLINKDIRMNVEYDDISEIPMVSDVQFVTGSADLNETLNRLRPGTSRPIESVESLIIPEVSAIPSSSSRGCLQLGEEEPKVSQPTEIMVREVVRNPLGLPPQNTSNLQGPSEFDRREIEPKIGHVVKKVASPTPRVTSFRKPAQVPTDVPAVPTKEYHCLTPHRREVQVAWFYGLDKFFLHPPDVNERLGEIELRSVQQHYAKLSANELVEDSPRVGLPCVARFQEDQMFYRALITAILDNQTAKILFVDFGNEQETSLADIKRILSKYMRIPTMAWHCKLAGIEFSPENFLDLQKHLGRTLLSKDKMKATFLRQDDDGVCLVKIRHSVHGDVTNYLMKKYLAQRPNLDHQPIAAVEKATSSVLEVNNARKAVDEKPSVFQIVTDDQCATGLLDDDTAEV